MVTRPESPSPTLAAQDPFPSQARINLDTELGPNVGFDPSKTNNFTSPFYVYNHDSPRPSEDLRTARSGSNTSESAKDIKDQPIHVSIRDLDVEGGSQITPSVTEEKSTAQAKQKRLLAQKLGFWRRKECKGIRTAKKQSWLRRLPKRQRLLVKMGIALFILGCMIAVAVGIAAALHSPVYGKSGPFAGA